MQETEKIVTGLRIPWSMIEEEVEGLYGGALLAELSEIIGYYNVYEKGANFIPETQKADFASADLHYKQARKLINKEARFLFAKHPDIWVTVPYDQGNTTETQRAEVKQLTTTLQGYVDTVFDRTNLPGKLVKAARDCFIGKRVAWFVNFDEVNKRIMVDFVPSLEFVFETDPGDTSKLTKIVTFYTVRDSNNKTEQRIYKKRYWLDAATKVCWLDEAIYDGTGQMVEEVTPARATKFVDTIPAGVIINDGLTGDLDGVSDIQELEDSESWFSRMANGDIDAERCGMNPIRWARDINPTTTKGLSIAPGAFWDVATDPGAPDGVSGELGMMETTLGYTTALNSTLGRIRGDMYEALDIPDVSPDALKGVVSSGKTLRAIYWPLIVRCDEKMLAWRPALREMTRVLIEGAKLYPGSASSYTKEAIPETPYDITVENQYPLPDDEAEEKQIDLAEVNAQTMSRRYYMKKWHNLTEAEATEELKQIALERELLEDSFSAPVPPMQQGQQQGQQEEEQNQQQEEQPNE